MNCNYYRATRDWRPALDINTFVDGRPLGYKAKLHFAIVGRGSARIRLYERYNQNSYEIGINILFTSQLKRKNNCNLNRLNF